MIHNLRIDNGRKSSFKNYWKIVEEQIEELQATAVDDKRHELISGFFCIISNVPSTT